MRESHLVMLNMILFEHHGVRYTNREVCEDSTQSIRLDSLESEIVRNFVDGEEGVLIRSPSDDVGEDEEEGREYGCVAEGNGDAELKERDEENNVFRQWFVAHQFRDLRSQSASVCSRASQRRPAVLSSRHQQFPVKMLLPIAILLRRFALFQRGQPSSTIHPTIFPGPRVDSAQTDLRMSLENRLSPRAMRFLRHLPQPVVRILRDLPRCPFLACAGVLLARSARTRI